MKATWRKVKNDGGGLFAIRDVESDDAIWRAGGVGGLLKEAQLVFDPIPGDRVMICKVVSVMEFTEQETK